MDIAHKTEPNGVSVSSGESTTEVRLEAKLAALETMPRQDLIPYWVEAYGRSPPKGLSRRILLCAAAYHLQAQVYGGLRESTKKKLRQIVAEHARRKAVTSSGKTPPPVGTRLIREWHGKTYVVDIIEDGYFHNATTHKSLSEIARLITGARWSGPRFFGL